MEKAEPVIWLEPALVCEVAYQMVTRDKKLRIPRFIRMRPDRKPEECPTDQLREVKVPSAVTETGSEPAHTDTGKRISGKAGHTRRDHQTLTTSRDPEENEELKRV